MKHAKESKDKTISGQLQGIIEKNGLEMEVTYCFPWPAKDETSSVINDN